MVFPALSITINISEIANSLHDLVSVGVAQLVCAALAFVIVLLVALWKGDN